MRPFDLDWPVAAGIPAAAGMPPGAFLARVDRLADAHGVAALDVGVDASGLAAADGWAHGRLVVEAGAALQGHALLAHLVAAAGGAVRVAGCLGRIVLPPVLALHLAVARALHPALHQHGLLAALACTALGLRSGQSDADCVQLAAIGLFHDVGLLHADDAVADGQAALTPAQRAQQAAHAGVSAALLRRHPVYAGAAADAVAAHHERLDGSGFPHHLRGDAVGTWGRIAALAELLTTLDTGAAILDALRLSNLLRLHGGAFDAGLVDTVLAACDAEERLPR
jgi:hypothetical protein